MNTQLNFNNIPLNAIERDGQIWIASKDLATALDYADSRSVSRIYNRYSDEFSSSMSLVVNLTTNGINNSLREKDTRIFSLRGCHLIAMFAKTAIAKEFRKWVLDVLDKLCNSVQQLPEQTHEYKSGILNSEEDKLKMLCMHVIWIYAWWKDYYPAISSMNSRATNTIFDRFAHANLFAKDYLKSKKIYFSRKDLEYFPWEGESFKKQSYIAGLVKW